MPESSWPRQSYEATVLLIPLAPVTRSWLCEQPDADLDGVTVAGDDLLDEQARFRPEPVPETGEGHAVSSPLEHAVHDADVVVLLTHDLAAVDHAIVVQLGDTARASGTLLGAVIVSPGARWERPVELEAAAVVREAADNVVILRDDRFVAAFLQVLRGGARPSDDLASAAEDVGAGAELSGVRS